MSARHVVLLTNFVPPYRVTLYRTLGQRLDSFRVMISTRMEADRPWEAQHEGLTVETQKALTFRMWSKHPYGFRDAVYVHLPYDTLSRLARVKPDVVVSDELGARTAQALVYRRLYKSSKLIIWATISEHSEEGRGFARRRLRQALLPLADAVLVNGASGVRYVKRFGVRSERIFVVPQTTDTVQFSSVPLGRSTSETRRLLYVGRLIELKGLLPFVSALSTWCETHPNENVQFWLVGDGPERAPLQKIAFPSNLEIRFCGNVIYDDLPAVYAQGGILVFPTLADTWGLVVNEAMAAGLPVLGSMHGQAIEELVRDGVTGWTFRPTRHEEMYTALDRALTTTPERLREMGATARRTVEHLTPELAADRIMDAIDFVSGEKRGER